MKRLSFFLLFLPLAGCSPDDIADPNLQPKLNEYFTASEISHDQANVLLIRTHLTNITEKLGAVLMAQVLRENIPEMKAGFSAVGYRQLVVEFDGGQCAWAPNPADVIYCAAKPAFFPMTVDAFSRGLQTGSVRRYAVFNRFPCGKTNCF